MKLLLLPYLLLIYFLLIAACETPGTSEFKHEGIVNGHKIKVFRYYYGDSDASVLIAFVDDTINSTTYQVGKIQESTIHVNEVTRINGEILVENDSLIIIKKQK